MSFCIKLVINISPCAWYWTFFFHQGSQSPFHQKHDKMAILHFVLELGSYIKNKERQEKHCNLHEGGIKVYRPNLLKVFQGHCFPPLPLLDMTNAIIGRALLDGLSTLMNYQGVFMRLSFQWISQSLTASKWSFYKMHHFAWTIFLIF